MLEMFLLLGGGGGDDREEKRREVQTPKRNDKEML